MNPTVLNAALAGLLHDVGKFAQRAGIKPTREFDPKEYGEHGYHSLLSDDFVSEYIPKKFQKGLWGVLYHHKPQDSQAQLVHIADILASSERRKKYPQKEEPSEARLVPILTQVELATEKSKNLYFHRLAALEVETDATYPSDEKGLDGKYKALWNQMLLEFKEWKSEVGDKWENQELESFFITLLAIFQKYMWCIPSATPWQTISGRRDWPDVSLFDHLRLTSAISACLTITGFDDQDLKKNKVMIVRGDVSGIQNFIFRITRAESETEHVAKRLRGRSFYLSILVDIIVDWILRELGLPSTCALYVGGGRFDLMLPSKISLDDISRTIDKWMLSKFQGELSLHIATCLAGPNDFADMRDVYRKLEENLEIKKQNKWHSHFTQPNFFTPSERLWHVCSVCRLTPLPDPGICDLCLQHEQIGKHLPYATHLVYVHSPDFPNYPQDQIISFLDTPMKMSVVIVREEDSISRLAEIKDNVVLYQINQTSKFRFPGLASSFRFMANTAPRAHENKKLGDTPLVQRGDVLHFEALAELSQGAKRIGVLKADVDRLGLIIGEGLVDEKNDLFPTISRVASLSRILDLFFSGLLNKICQDEFYVWRQTSSNSERDKIDNCFYVLYSGGDDLFIVGPWDATLKLALRLRKEFQRFSGMNPNLTISAGYVQVKPRFPTQKFAELVEKFLKSAKNSGRNRISAFNQVMEWENTERAEVSLEWLFNFSYELVLKIDQKAIHRGILFDLGQIHRQHNPAHPQLFNPMWTPRLYYTLSRRLKQEDRDHLGPKIIKAMSGGKILVSVSIASLVTRKE